jgi:hypothetical protein
MAAPSRKTEPYLKIEEDAVAQRGDGFVVFIIGATPTKNLGSLERIMQRQGSVVT